MNLFVLQALQLVGYTQMTHDLGSTLLTYLLVITEQSTVSLVLQRDVLPEIARTLSMQGAPLGCFGYHCARLPTRPLCCVVKNKDFIR